MGGGGGFGGVGSQGGGIGGGDEEDDGGPLVPCPDCGRKFKEKAFEKHAKICKKVFMQKRKAFDSVSNRLGELDNAGELIANAKKNEKELENPKPKPEKTAQAVPEWQKKSLAFRQAMLAAKAATGDVEAGVKAAEIKKQLDAAGGSESSDMVKCPHCGRTFNKEAGERHVAICLKTFGSKNGGGSGLKKGGGSNSQNARPGGGVPAAKPSAAGPPPSAANRRPSQNRR